MNTHTHTRKKRDHIDTKWINYTGREVDEGAKIDVKRLYTDKKLMLIKT